MKQIFSLTCIVALFLVAGCKKEYEQVPYNYTNILSFSYTDSTGTVHKAAVQGDSIIVYWPEYLKDTIDITPAIVVAKKATVDPAAGAAIKLATGTPVTVTAEDGTQKIYYLKLIENLPDIVFNEALPFNIARGGAWTFRINGNDAIKNIYMDDVNTRAFAVADDGTEYELQVSFPDDGIWAETGDDWMRFTIGFDIAVGSYRLKVVNAGRSRTTEGKVVKIQYLRQRVYDISEADITIKRGGTISLEGEFSQDFSNVYPDNFDLRLQKVVYDTVSAYPKWGEILRTEYLPGTFTFVEHTDSTITFNVPEEIPVGRYIYSAGFNFVNGISYRFVRSDNGPGIGNDGLIPILTITD